MGCCASSTEYVTDPVTGQTKEKKALGGAYPGQRRPQHNPYTPGPNDFDKTGQAVAHFKAYGGGTALTLVQQDGSAQPQSGPPVPGHGGSAPQYVQVTLPQGVYAGQEIHVQAPDGKVNAIIVPSGFGPGSTFTVEFAPSEAPKTSMNTNTNNNYNNNNNNNPMAQAEVYNSNINSVNQNFDSTPVAQAQPVHGGDDGFASGFGRR